MRRPGTPWDPPWLPSKCSFSSSRKQYCASVGVASIFSNWPPLHFLAFDIFSIKMSITIDKSLGGLKTPQSSMVVQHQGRCTIERCSQLRNALQCNSELAASVISQTPWLPLRPPTLHCTTCFVEKYWILIHLNILALSEPRLFLKLLLEDMRRESQCNNCLNFFFFGKPSSADEQTQSENFDFFLQNPSIKGVGAGVPPKSVNSFGTQFNSAEGG